MLMVALSFDYDSPAGFENSFGLKSCPPDADQKGAELILDVLRRWSVKATFGVVAEAALPGKPPRHCVDQIRQIATEGHEIASHSVTHRFLPPMSTTELVDEVVLSRQVLEECTGRRVAGFIPPFNRPMSYPSRGAISFAEMFGLHGRGIGRQTIGTMLDALREAGYRWCRVSFETKLEQLSRALRRGVPTLPRQPFLASGVTALPLHVCGFGDSSRRLVRRHLGESAILTLYGHPSQANSDGPESAGELSLMFETFEADRAGGKITFVPVQEAVTCMAK